jgi:hypothetical protein
LPINTGLGMMASRLRWSAAFSAIALVAAFTIAQV